MARVRTMRRWISRQRPAGSDSLPLNTLGARSAIVSPPSASPLVGMHCLPAVPSSDPSLSTLYVPPPFQKSRTCAAGQAARILPMANECRPRQRTHANDQGGHPRRLRLHGPRTHQDPAAPSPGRDRGRDLAPGRCAARRRPPSEPGPPPRPALRTVPRRPPAGAGRAVRLQLPAARGQHGRVAVAAATRSPRDRPQRRLPAARPQRLRPVVRRQPSRTWPTSPRRCTAFRNFTERKSRPRSSSPTPAVIRRPASSVWPRWRPAATWNRAASSSTARAAFPGPAGRRN